MSIKARANLRLKLNSKKQLMTILNALTPEAQASPTHRASIKLKEDGLFLVLAVDAEDTVALRATLNAYLHWVNSAINVIDIVENQKSF
jgi:tRNA threonylcarbamoyladenosine modification (KEOPS) complex  Pcc1 subunit